MNPRGLLLVGALALVGCARPWLPVAVEADLPRIQARWPGATLESLNHGRTLVIRRCSSCHQPPSPQDELAEDWPLEVSDMAERSGLRDGEGELLNLYLAAYARDQVTPPR